MYFRTTSILNCTVHIVHNCLCLCFDRTICSEWPLTHFKYAKHKQTHTHTICGMPHLCSHTLENEEHFSHIMPTPFSSHSHQTSSTRYIVRKSNIIFLRNPLLDYSSDAPRKKHIRYPHTHAVCATARAQSGESRKEWVDAGYA